MTTAKELEATAETMQPRSSETGEDGRDTDVSVSDDGAASGRDTDASEVPTRSDDLEIGHVVAERYEVLEVIGRGTSGTVYRARDLFVDSEHEIVALKVIHARLHSDRQIYGRFRREAEILRRLEGPHLVKLLEHIEEDGLLMLTLEHVDGPSLDDYLRDHGELPVEEVIAIVTQMCSALSSAHEAGVIHRDLKPSNVLIQGARSKPTGDDDEPPMSFLGQLSVRVVDFGLSKMVAGDYAGTALTEQDMIFGTPDYMAPEQVAGDELDHRCDVYAAGVILYELVVGRLPFDTPGALTTMSAHLNTPVPPPSEIAPADRKPSAALERVILKALSKKPEDRYATAADLAAALSEVDSQTAPALASQGLDFTDTRLEHSQTAISTTMQSEEVEDEVEQVKATARGAKVRVVVKDAEPVSSKRRQSAVPQSAQAPDDERRLWIGIGIVMAILAVLAGVYFGAQG